VDERGEDRSHLPESREQARPTRARHSGFRHLRPYAQVRIGETDPHAHERSSHRERLRRTSAVRAESCTDAISPRGVPLPGTSDSSRPGRTIGPSLIVRRRSWGSSLRRFAPAYGCPHISVRPGPHAFSSRRPTRLIFVGLARLARMSKVRERANEPGAIRCWLLGFAPVCGPFRDIARTHARPSHSSRSFLPWALPLSGLWAHVRALTRARPRVNHQPPDTPLSASHPLVGLSDPSRMNRRFDVLPPNRAVIPSMTPMRHHVAGPSACWRG
jgi:hypothetical protein